MAERTNRIAVIGHACRFPGGADTPDKFWEMLLSGVDAVTQVPEGRFDQRRFFHPKPGQPGKSYTFAAGTLGDVAGFDAAFFGISAREAAQMDPQQRLLLELTWEAFERAGQVPSRLAGSNCAVYIGISSSDYGEHRMGDLEVVDSYFMLGATLSIAANRISYAFDLKGPSLAVDTACSSSLVALDEAVRAIQAGRASMAVVGGVNLLLSPGPFVGFSAAGMLSRDGRCRAFAKGAEGYVRAEGGGVVILKPLGDAVRDGDPILAVLRGVGTNADGRTHGIAMPSAQMQEALLRSVYRTAGVSPKQLSYFEAHGTGTQIGDPIEASAIGRALGQRRSKKEPLLIGSVKSNIGHLESAAGIAGLIKGIEILRHGIVPASLHLEELNPDIPFSDLNIAPVRSAVALPHRDKAIIGVNSFGFGGANGHAIIEAYDAVGGERVDKKASRRPFVISGRSDEALSAAVRATRAHLATSSDESWSDIAYTACCRRTHHEHRLIFRADSVRAAVACLESYKSQSKGRYQSGTSVGANGKTALVFAGNGSQWPGMGARLLKEDSVFRDAVARIDKVARWRLGWSILQMLDSDQARMDDTRIAQPLLFALQIGLVESFRERGLKFDAVVGHSVGEVAAACVAGALSLEQSIHLIHARSDAQGRTRGTGRMLAASVGAATAINEIRAYNGAIELAAINSPRAVTFAGEIGALRDLMSKFDQSGVAGRLLDLDYAFHSASQDLIHDGILRALSELKPMPGEMPFYSTVMGRRIAGTDLGADYWWHNIREKVQFAAAIEALAHDGHQIFVEVGPQPRLQSYIRHTLLEHKKTGQQVKTLARTDAGLDAVEASVDRAFVAGAQLAFDKAFPTRGRVVALPTYPWQRETQWRPPSPETGVSFRNRFDGSLLGLRVAPDVTVWERQFDLASLPILADHVVGGLAVVPAAVYMEVALQAGRILFPGKRSEIEMLEIFRPLVIEADQGFQVRFSWTASDGIFRIESRPRMSGGNWLLHVTGRLSVSSAASSTRVPMSVTDGVAPITKESHYAFASSHGFDYGPYFAVVQEAWVSGNDVVAALDLSDSGDTADNDYCLDPALLDGILQTAFFLLRSRLEIIPQDARFAFVPHKIGRFVQGIPGTGPFRAEMVLKRELRRSFVVDCVLRDAKGEIAADLRDVRFSAIALGRASTSDAGLLRTAIEPLEPVDALPAPAGAHAAARGALQAYRAPERAAWLYDVAEKIAAAIACDTLIELGSAPAAPQGEALLSRLIDIAETIPEAGEGWDVAWGDAMHRYPELLAELTVLGRVGLKLPEIIANAAVPPEPSTALLEHLFDSAPLFAPSNDAIVETVARFTKAWPSHRRMRVLIVGRLGLVRRLLAELPSGNCAVTLAGPDIARLGALARTCAERYDVTLLETDLLDAAVAPAQGFDLLVAAHSLPAGAEPAPVLANFHAWAAPGATFLVAECAEGAWAGLSFPSRAARWNSADRSLAASVIMAGFERSETIRCAAADVVIAEVSNAVPARVQAERKSWLVFGGEREREFVDRLCQSLAELGQTTQRIEASADCDWQDSEDWREYWARVSVQGRMPFGLIHVAGLKSQPQSTVGQLRLQDERCLTLLAAIAGLRGADSAATLTLRLVTGRAFSGPEGEETRPAQAPLAGLGRVIQNEYPEAACRIVDFHECDSDRAEPIHQLAREIIADTGEGEVLLTQRGRFGPRLRRAVALPRALDENELDVLQSAGGSLDNLRWIRAQRRTLARDEVEVEVKAVGLNFRDVMMAMGVLPEEIFENGFAGANLGMEAAGIVARVGAAISDLAPGDRVICFAPAAFATHLVTRRFATARLPEKMSFAQGATITAAFFTVTYSLKHLARLSAGERILVHGAAGGVGMAAVQYAQYCGAEIFATAGSDEKRELVKLMGVPEDHIFDSRSTDFADRIAAVSDGVDVVLNSLAGEAVHRGISVLKPFGRFIELGKVDFLANTRVGLRPFRNNIAYYGVDADLLMAEKPALAAAVLDDTLALFRLGAYSPLPYRIFPREEIEDAFRHMQRSSHSGKIVVTIEPAAAPAAAPEKAKRVAIDPNSIYIVTGGLGGLGLSCAQWLTAHGARNLVLVSRSGACRDEDRLIVAELETAGARVDLVKCDIAQEGEVDTLLTSLRARGLPIKGVIHAAAHYDDAFLAEQSPARFRSVLGPKVSGGWALHRATRGLDLDIFLCFSSVSATIGNPGQANYVAANLYLESLITLRRSLGLAAQLVALGPIKDVGYLARNSRMLESFSQMGLKPLLIGQVWAHLDEIVFGAPAGDLLVDAKWPRLRGLLRAVAAPKFQGLLTNAPSNDDVTSDADFASIIQSLPPEKIFDFLQTTVTEMVAQILRVAPEKVDTERSVFDLGMDSLMALELRMMLEERIGVEISPMLLSQEVGIRRISELIYNQALGGAAKVDDAPASDSVTAEHAYILNRHHEDVDKDLIVEALEALDRTPAQGAGL